MKDLKSAFEGHLKDIRKIRKRYGTGHSRVSGYLNKGQTLYALSLDLYESVEWVVLTPDDDPSRVGEKLAGAWALAGDMADYVEKSPQLNGVGSANKIKLVKALRSARGEIHQYPTSPDREALRDAKRKIKAVRDYLSTKGL